MTDILDPDSGPAAIPSNDQRPNSGLREGDIPHARVNESIRLATKTIVFGQQNRLRNGLLMEDDQLRRFHAGHDLVKFFYGGVRQIPGYLLDAILAFVDAVSEERATEQRHITANFFDGYDTVAEFKKKLQDHSDTLPEGAPGSVCNDFNELLGVGLLQAAHTQFQRFRTLRRADQEESRHVLRELIYFLLGIRRPDLEESQKEEMIATPEHWRPAQQVDRWLDLAERLLPSGDDPGREALLVIILRKLERHPLYHQLFLEQARQLSSSPELAWGADVRDQVEQLYALIPDQPYRLSSDPQALQNRLHQFKRLHQKSPDDGELFPLLAGILLRLDQADNYHELAETVGKLGNRAEPALRELIDTISHRDARRRKIRAAALYLLRAGRPEAT